MNIRFKSLDLKSRPISGLKSTVQLQPNNWDDYTFKTQFEVTFCDENGKSTELGSIKIGYVGQKSGWTRDKLEKDFPSLPEGWFSLGQDVDYYKAISELDAVDQEAILSALRDVVADDKLLARVENEEVFEKSLTRGVSSSVIHGQYRRILEGGAPLTDFQFDYVDPGDEKRAAIDLRFEVEASSKPTTNIHVLIGRNGVGKTTLLNNMVEAIVVDPAYRGAGRFIENSTWKVNKELPKDYFSGVVSISFSAFDPFVPPEDQPDTEAGTTYFYIGMKTARGLQNGSSTDIEKSAPSPPKTHLDLIDDFVRSFSVCLSQPAKTKRWLQAIDRLKSDDNFADMNLHRLLDHKDRNRAIADARTVASRMSSGHSIVLLTITKLVEVVEEKSLVLLDEPESHLHPPLLSAFTRALSDLLHDRNGVAIIATHSPVVLQEVPKSCVWKLQRRRASGRSDRPERETFGENVGVLTREIFGLEVEKSGFHDLLVRDVEGGESFDVILKKYKGQLGAEAQGILRALIAARDLEALDE